MRKELRTRILLFSSLGLASILALYLVFGPSGLLHVHRLKQEKATLDKQISQLEKENEQLKHKISRLEDENDVYRETVAREKLGLVKPDENIVVFKPVPEGEVKKP